MAVPKLTNDSHKKFGEPAIFVSADKKSDFERQLDLDFSVLNVNKLENNLILTSPTFFVQSLPFYIAIERQKKKASKKANEIDNFNIRLIVGNGIQAEWSSNFSVNFHSNEVFELDKFIESELSDTNNQILHIIEWEKVSTIKNLFFQMQITAERPNGGYEWPSYAATGYNGLVNEGATCYINCLLQSLYHTNEFRRLIYGISIESADVNDSFLFWLKYIFFALQFNGLPKITTKKLIKCFNWSEMNESSQQDVQEFLRLLMAEIERFVDGTEFKQRLNDLFVGTIKSTITCKNVRYSSSIKETFWDIPLPIDKNPNVYVAFGELFDAITINDFRYGDGADQDEALQEYEIIQMPPILHLHLKRFYYDVTTHTSKKNNKPFEFYPQLDLSQYCDDAIYTLHSVLVHSGSLNSGHYMAFIRPQAGDQWYKFNDEVVTKCSAVEAIQKNYGDDCSSKNAYVLVYIKTSCIEQILQDISEKDISAKALIECELSKEIEEISNRDKFYEIVVFTPNTLENHVKLKSGRYLFDSRHGLKFYIEKEKTFGDLKKSLIVGLQVDECNSISFWLVNTTRESIYVYDVDLNSAKPIKSACAKDRLHIFVETCQMEPNLQKNQRALIFIKEYDSKRNQLIFHMYRYFMLDETVGSLRAFIKGDIGYDGDAENIAIMIEKGSGEQYNCRVLEAKHLIGKIASKCNETHSALVVFEIIDKNHNPKYFQFAGAASLSKQKIESDIEKIENRINVVAKKVTGEEYLRREFLPTDHFSNIIRELSAIHVCTHEQIQLLDTENNIIDEKFFGISLEEYLEHRNENRRTRGQKQKSLIFLFNFVDNGHDQTMEIDSVNRHSNTSSLECGVPMKCSTPIGYYYSDSMELDANHIVEGNKEDLVISKIPDIKSMMVADEPMSHQINKVTVKFIHEEPRYVQHVCECGRSEKMDNILERFAKRNETSVYNLNFYNKNRELIRNEGKALELFLDVNDIEMEIYFQYQTSKTSKRSTPIERSSNANHQCQMQLLYLTFKDKTAERNPIDLNFSGSTNLSVAFDQIASCMELDRTNSHFFNSDGDEISDSNITVSQYLKHNSPNIEYMVIDQSKFQMQDVMSSGINCGMITVAIDESTTIGDICTQYGNARVLRMKDGLIRAIVPFNTKVTELITDSYVYRLERCQTTNQPYDFDVCIRFIKDSPAERVETPLLIKLRNGDTLQTLSLNIMGILANSRANDLFRTMKQFEFFIDGKPIPGDYVFVRPDDPEFIQVISLNMNQKRNTSYSRFLYNLRS